MIERSEIRKVVVLTGAGISAESGIRTFRDKDGLWEGHRMEEVATPGAFASKPEVVHRFYNQRRLLLSEVKPNAAHAALVDLESRFGDAFLLVTQNVDDLHERAGSRRILHMHGELLKARCAWCEAVDGVASSTVLAVSDQCRNCGRDGGMRPDIVWFGEMPFHLDRIFAAIDEADLFVAIGTSGVVAPASEFVRHAKVSGAKCVEINLEAAANSAVFDQTEIGPATASVPAFVAALLERSNDESPDGG